MKKPATSYLLSRRSFIQACSVSLFASKFDIDDSLVFTVNGKLKALEMGKTLIHEHILVDFIGADKISSERWKHEEVIRKVLPYLLEVKSRGINTIVECTPAFLGRDPKLLQKLSQESGMQIITNTGYYGASDNKYLPAHAFTESAEQLAKRWIDEFENGIDGTDIKPGFIKIGVDSGALSDLHRKLVKAAALTHLKTGLTICSHTGPSLPARQELEILQGEGVSARAFVWVHANGKNEEIFETAKLGCWVSLDGINTSNVQEQAALIGYLKSKGMLGQILISHDAGWYKPGEPGGGEFRGFTTISDQLLPLLKKNGFSDSDFEVLLVKNPAAAFAIAVRRS